MLESSLSTEQISKLKGTGRNGMLTKGDVLFAMGQIKNAYGSAEKINLDIMGSSGHRASEVSLRINTYWTLTVEPVQDDVACSKGATVRRAGSEEIDTLRHVAGDRTGETDCPAW